jgi:hypothetical protein
MAYRPKLPSAKEAVPEEPRSPVKVLRIDDVSCSIFKRSGKGRDYYGVSFSRSYKDMSGTWRYTKSFDFEDLGKIVSLCQQADEYIRGELGMSEQTA